MKNNYSFLTYIIGLALFISSYTHAGDINSAIALKTEGKIQQAKIALSKLIKESNSKNSVVYLRAKLELAKIQFEQNQYQEAKAAFLEILKNNQLPSNVRKNIQLQLNKINKVENQRKKYGFKGKIDTFIGYSSNVKFESIIDDEYPDSGEDYENDGNFDEPLEEPFEDFIPDFEDDIDDEDINEEDFEENIVISEQDDLYYGLSAHINHKAKVNDSSDLKIGLLHIARQYDEVESSNFSSTSIYLTPSYKKQLTINLQGTHIRRADENYANYVGVYPSYIFNNTGFNTHLKLGISKRTHHHDYNSNRDGIKYLTDLHLSFPIKEKSSFRIGAEYSTLNIKEAFRSYNSYEIYSNANFNLTPSGGLFTAFSYKKSIYDDVHPDLDKTRERELKRLDLGINYMFNKHIGLKVNYSNLINSENIDEFDYSKYNLQSHLQILF